MKATTKITKSQDGEFRVRLFINGQYQAGADYFTDDKQDARETAKAMVETAKFSEKNNATAKAEQQDYEAEQA